MKATGQGRKGEEERGDEGRKEGREREEGRREREPGEEKVERIYNADVFKPGEKSSPELTMLAV